MVARYDYDKARSDARQVTKLSGINGANGANGVHGGPTKTRPARTFHRGDHVEIARALVEDLSRSDRGELVPLTHDDGDFWRCDDAARCVWSKLPLEAVEHRVTEYAGARVVEGDKARTLKIGFGAVKGVAVLAANDLRARAGRLEFRNAKAGIGFTNGFAVVENGRVRLLPHAPEHMARHAYDFDFNADLPHPMLDQFLEEVFWDCIEEERGARIALFQEFVGVCLAGFATERQRALVMFGPGGNGKSEALRIARGMFPDGAVVTLPPHQWGERFQLARLVGARANFCDELPDRDVTSGDTWKAVISGEPQHAERKNQHPFQFAPRAGHIFNTNTPIGSYDASDGYWRRLILLPFTRNMERSGSHRVSAGADVIAVERAAAIAWFLTGAARVQRQNGFTMPAQSLELVQQWRRESDPVRLFLHERMTLDQRETETVAASVLYDAFVAWCTENRHQVVTSTRFGRKVMATGVYERKESNRGRVYVRKPRANWVESL